jgi:6-phosphogluconolactonase
MRVDLDFQEFGSTSMLDTELTARVSKLLGEALIQDGHASIVVSGGRTPKGFFQRLSQENLDWSNITVSLADERWVEPNHCDSNEKLVKENLLINNASGAKFLPLKNNAATAMGGIKELESQLANVEAFTVVILGMGDDGHTASLFPGSETLGLGLDLSSGKQCIAVTPLDAPHERMSMTLPRLLRSKQIIIHLCGEGKKRVLDQVNSGYDSFELPIRAVLQQSHTPVSLYWSR